MDPVNIRRPHRIVPVQQAGKGTLLPWGRTSRHPDVHQTTTGNWLERQNAAPPVVKVSQVDLKRWWRDQLHWWPWEWEGIYRSTLSFLGFSYSIFNCVSLRNQAQVSDTFCDSSKRPTPQEEACNLQSCPALWEMTHCLSVVPAPPHTRTHLFYVLF